MENKIYVIMTMTKLNKDKWPDFGSTAMPGFYTDKDSAFKTVKNNVGDLWETCYDYALVEEIAEGIYNPATSGNRWWFKYNMETNKYDEIEEPDFTKGFCGFTIS